MADRELTAEEIAASVAHSRAEADAATAAAEKSRAEARKASAEAETAELALAKLRRTERDELAADKHHHVYNFDQVVGDSSVKACISQLTSWSRNDPKCSIELRLNSPGGDIIEGFALIDFLFDLRHKGHVITTVALGMAASMAAVILQAGDTRVIGSNAILLIHEGSLGAIGSFGEVEDRVKLMKIFHERILELFEHRARPINSKTTKAFLRKNWNRMDWWIGSAQALTLGLVDEVR